MKKVAWIACIWLGATLIFSGYSMSYATEGDTPETVMAAAKETSAALATVNKEAQAIASHMQDKAYAERLLALVNKKDKQGVLKLLKEDAPKSEITVLEMGDWRVRIAIKTKYVDLEVCFGSDTCK